SDWYFCLAGELAVEVRTPSDRRIVEVGGSYAIPPDTAHQISNGGTTECRFLLIQGVGQYDFHAVEVR
ncbi:MAG: cupin domain-containing protein, partial [candidate division Zixibacteria bacterium]|nr:cupin domain-containing protein [candidate division Zixibacteria bacterium]